MRKTNDGKTKRGPVAWRLMAVAITTAVVLSAAAAVSAQSDNSTGEIDVVWDEDDMGFNVTSSKEISNIIVLLCDGTAHKHEVEFAGDNITTWEHRENQTIQAIWVKAGNNHDPDGTAPPAPFDNRGAGEYFANEGVDCDPEEPVDPEPVCEGPASIEARTVGEDILVSWTAVDNASAYNLYRAAGDGGFELLVSTNQTEVLDNTVENGTTYTYMVTAIVDGVETDACDRVTITAIPVFPTVLAGLLASIAGLGAYAFMRRRK